MLVVLPVEVIRLRDLFLNFCFDLVDVFVGEASCGWLLLLPEDPDVVHALKPRSL